MNQPSSKPTQAESAIEPFTLDCDHILTHAGGDPALLMQLCGGFLGELPVRIDAMHKAIKQRNSLVVGRALQQLHNCLIVFGSGQLSAAAESLEAALRDGRFSQVQREWKRLQQRLQVVVPQVQRLMLEVATPTSAVQ